MSELPTFFNVKNVRARKTHVCCECRDDIGKKEKYVLITGKWDGEIQRFRQCLNCYDIMNKATNLAVSKGDDPPCFMELSDWFYGFMWSGFKGREFVEGLAEDIGVAPENLNKLLKVDILNDE